jgi:hypothetical protein
METLLKEQESMQLGDNGRPQHSDGEDLNAGRENVMRQLVYFVSPAEVLAG